MKICVLLILPLIISAMGIKVPVDNDDNSGENVSKADSTSASLNQSRPIYYTLDEAVDSYLIPPDPHKPEEVLPDTVVTPATYLLPPTADTQGGYYYAPSDADEQSDWYPIAQQQEPQSPQVQLLPPRQQSDAIPIFLSSSNQSKPFKVIQNPRAGKLLGDRFNIPIPSIKLEPPAEDAPNDYIIRVPSEELELPAEEIDQPYRPVETNPKDGKPIVSHRPQTKLHLRKFKNPTKLYPKKFKGVFRPVPIPIGQFAEDSSLEIPIAKPVKYFKPAAGIEGIPPTDEKRIYLYEQAEQKRKLKEPEEAKIQDFTPENYVQVPPTEQDASETYGYPERNVYPPYPSVPLRAHPSQLIGHPAHLRGHPVPVRGPPAPLRVAPQEPPAAQTETQQQPQAPPAPDDRTEFRMHGMKGPHSYQFGYDTGKGKNRQFRYEERDNDGLVRGHYGYMDKHGKLRVVNYRAHPEHGFQAEPQEEQKE